MLEAGRHLLLTGAGALWVTLVAWDGLALAADRPPVLRVGLMSDTHVNCDLGSCERTRLALETFRREHVDVVAHLGDLANFHWPEAFRNYRRTLDAVYPDRSAGPRFLYAWGNHDSIDYSRRQQKDRQMDRSEAFAVMKEIIGIDHGLAFETEIGGYAFLGFPETVTDVCSWKEFERRVAAACARHPGKPVFVLHHPPPRNTCDRSEKGCCATSRTIFNRHPQVVALSGHLHTTVLNERSIWQGEFTEVQTSCLYNWLAEAEGSKPQARSGWGVTVMDVYDDRLEFRRFDVRDPAERGRERRWTVPLPFVPSQAPYALARRKADEPVGVFAADAAVTVAMDGKPGPATIRFPTVVNPEVVRTYRVEVERRNGDAWEPLCRADAFGDFDELPCNRRGFLESRIETARLGPAGTCRFTVTPEGFFGALGKPLVRELKVEGLSGASTRRLRFGVLADIHVNTPQSYPKFERALAVLRDEHVDAVMCCGDLSDYGIESELQAVADIWRKVFPENRLPDGSPVVNLFHYGDHDTGGTIHKRMGAKRVESFGGREALEKQVIAFNDRKAVWEKCFREPWSPILHKTVNGYDFILANFTIGELDNKYGNNTPGVEEFMAGLPGLVSERPFFFSQHRVYRKAVCGDEAWGSDDGKSTALLSRYPNCIAFCGHAHRSFADERSICQDAGFTAVQVPSLSYVDFPEGRANAPFVVSEGERKGPYGIQTPAVPYCSAETGFVVDVYDHEIVIRRMDFQHREEAAPAWVVPVPLPPAGKRPFEFANRKKTKAPPEFPEGTKVEVRATRGKNRAGKGLDQVIVSFPPVAATAGTWRAFDYEIVAEGRDRKIVRTVYSNLNWQTDQRDRDLVRCAFARAELPDDVTFTIRPRDSFGRAGRAIRFEGGIEGE